jgi:hypothetical protein
MSTPTQSKKQFLADLERQRSREVLPPTPGELQQLIDGEIDALLTDDGKATEHTLFRALCGNKISVLDFIYEHEVVEKKRKQVQRDMVAWAAVATQLDSLPFELVRHIATSLPGAYTLGDDNGQPLFDKLIEGVLRVRNAEHCTTRALSKRVDPLLVLAASMTGVDWTKLNFRKRVARRRYNGTYILYEFMRWGARNMRHRYGPRAHPTINLTDPGVRAAV